MNKPSAVLISFDTPGVVLVQLDACFGELTFEQKGMVAQQAFQKATNMLYVGQSFQFSLPFIANTNLNFGVSADGTLDARSCSVAQGFNILVMALMENIAFNRASLQTKAPYSTFILQRNHSYERFLYTGIA